MTKGLALELNTKLKKFILEWERGVVLTDEIAFYILRTSSLDDTLGFSDVLPEEIVRGLQKISDRAPKNDSDWLDFGIAQAEIGFWVVPEWANPTLEDRMQKLTFRRNVELVRKLPRSVT